MGTWSTGPFDNDTAADYALALDAAKPDEREALIRGVLARTAHATGEFWEVQEAVAAASVIAAQCPGGESVDSAYGPQAAMPPLPADLPALAAKALGRILDDTHLTTYWVRPQDADRWLTTLTRLHEVLAPPPTLTGIASHGPATRATADRTRPAQQKPPVPPTTGEYTVLRSRQTHRSAPASPTSNTPHHRHRHR
ncbi:DUF4259 domain-containing protein [Streptomyces sp. CT34]|uniref:DUF4259 domain-containing protein n=1 Tax=Streptomyces sp. CT34 TaxID=1553907 RepID=UPI00099C8C98|nr:DUF4259 domain-containing protein [Streptomyces sp. CT34]